MRPFPEPSSQEFNVCIRLSLQRALLDSVGPNLAAVSFRVEGDVVTISFRFRNEPSEEDIEDASVVVSEVYADLPESIRVEDSSSLLDEKPYLEGHTSVFCVKM